MPPRTHRYARAPPRSAVQASVSPARTETARHGATGRSPRRAPGSAPVSATTPSPSNRNEPPTIVISSAAAPSSFPTSRFPMRQRERVRGARRGDARRRVTRAGPGPERSSGIREPRRRSRSCSPARSGRGRPRTASRACSVCRVEQHELGPADDVPAAGGAHRVDPRLGARRSRRFRRERSSWASRGAACAAAPGRPGEVGEPRREPDELNFVRRPGMRGDDLGDVETGQARDLEEIGTVGAAVAHRDHERARSRRRKRRERSTSAVELRGESAGIAAQRVVGDEEGFVGGVQVDDGLRPLAPQPLVQDAHARSGSSACVVEDDEQGAIAGVHNARCVIVPRMGSRST